MPELVRDEKGRFDQEERMRQTHVTQAVERKRVSWTIVKGHSNSDANAKLRKAVKDAGERACIRTLNMTGHGNKNYFLTRSVNSKGNFATRAVGLRLDKKWKAFGLEVFSKVRFCTTCTITISTCYSAYTHKYQGTGREVVIDYNGTELTTGEYFYQQIANATGCTIKGWRTKTWGLTCPEGLLSTGSQSGNDPTVVVSPDIPETNQ